MNAIAPNFRSSARSPGRILAVWLFCIAAIVFWIAVLQVLTAIPLLIAGLLAGGFSLACLPMAGHLAAVIWQHEADG